MWVEECGWGEDGVAVGVEVDPYAKVPAVRDFTERAQGLLAA